MRPRLTIDLGAVAENWRRLDRLSGDAETAAAVKADGYGCGAEAVARALSEAGCRTYFVATPEEGVALRRTQREAAIHILNGATEDEIAAAKTNGLIPCLNTPAQLAAWRAADGGDWALQIDSGMSRLGMQRSEVAALIAGGCEPAFLARCSLVMSHMACADERGSPENERQRSVFAERVRALGPHLPKARHSLAATGATLLGRDYHLDLVRCGIGLYGGLPLADAAPVVTLTAPIRQIREIEAGAFVGYGASWRAERPSRIATLALGYADGLLRALSNRGTVFLDGHPAPLAGRVSMDLITIDVTDHPQAAEGSEVELLGPNQSVDALAAAAGTIGYEILTALGDRYVRVYRG